MTGKVINSERRDVSKGKAEMKDHSADEVICKGKYGKETILLEAGWHASR